MSTYLYCVLAPPDPDALPPSLTGIAGAPVRSLGAPELGDLEAWVATIDDAALRLRGRDLAAQALAHNEVVNAALATGRTPAPARYGSRFADDAACVADLSRRGTELGAILGNVAGAVEMSALLVPAAARALPIVKPRTTDAAAGRRYLEAVRLRARDQEQRRAAADAEAERISNAVGEFVRGESRSFTPSGVLSIAHLVPTGAVAHYKNALAGLTPSDSFRLVLGDARAPYSFTVRVPNLGGHDSGSPKRSG